MASSNAAANHNSNLGEGTPNERQSHHSYHTTGRQYHTPDANISTVLVDHAHLTDPSLQRLRQGRLTESEMLLTNLGNSLVELGRATARISMGERPVTSIVSRLQSLRSWMQTSTGEGNLPLATTGSRNAEITRNVRVGFLWPSPSIQQHVSSPQLSTEEELEEADLEDEMEEHEDPDPNLEDEMVKRVTSSSVLYGKRDGWSFVFETLFFWIGIKQSE